MAFITVKEKADFKLANVRELLVPYSATSQELSGAAKASLQLGLGHPL